MATRAQNKLIQKRLAHIRFKRFRWTGFSGKTLWDWLQLLIVPIVLAGAGFWLTQKQHDTDIQIATAQQQETTLETYLDKMSDLLTDKHLKDPKLGIEARAVARSRTLTALSRLDATRNDRLIQFLREAQLLQKGHPIVDLSNADLRGDKLSGINLSGIDLSGVKLNRADLQGTNLSGSYLWRADLREADLRKANLEGAYLWRADLTGTNLGETDLMGADLSRSQLCGANLGKINLNNIVLSNAMMPDCKQIHAPQPRPSLSHKSDLGDDETQWQTFIDGKGHATATISKVTDPNINGTALQISLHDGDPFTNVQAYRNLLAHHIDNTFELSLSFYLTDIVPIQAFEITMNQWVDNKRWEWAMQWENVGDNTLQRGNPPTWRIWDGKAWLDIGFQQRLTPGNWYKFDLRGNIDLNNNVHYISCTCAGIPKILDRTFAPVSNIGDKQAIGVQLDGDEREEPYDIYIDEIDFQRSFITY